MIASNGKRRLWNSAVSRWLIVGLTFQAFALLWNCWANSPTIDEPGHLQSGLIIHKYSRFEVYAVNPPLIRVLATLPAYASGLGPYDDRMILDPAERWEFAAGTRLFGESGIDAMRGLSISRTAIIPLVLLGSMLIWRWAADAFGMWPAILATMLWILSPMVLGHGALITPDVGATVVGTFALFRFRLWLKNGSLWNSSLWGVATGLALLCKFTWLVVLPLSFLVVYVFWKRFVFSQTRKFSCDFLQICFVFAVSLVVVNAGYGFDRSITQLGEIKFVSQRLKATQDQEQNYVLRAPPNRFTDSAIHWLPIPLPQLYVQGIDVQMRDFEPGMMGRSFLNGQWRDRGWWHYYLAAAIIKVPVPALALMILSACIGVSHFVRVGYKTTKRKAFRKQDCARCGEVLICAIPSALVFILVSSQTGFNHHYRYVLLAYPGAYLATAGILASVRHHYQRAIRIIAISFLCIQVVAVVTAAPHWIGYTNRIATLVKPKDKLLSDSNLDWGQDLLRLKTWQLQNPDKSPLRVIAFSHVVPHDLGIQSESIGLTISPNIFETKHINRSDLSDGWYAVSTCVQQGRWFKLYDNTSGAAVHIAGGLEFFSELTPVTRIGSSIELFYLRSQPIQ